jgi:hypothetical protein
MQTDGDADACGALIALIDPVDSNFPIVTP